MSGFNWITGEKNVKTIKFQSQRKLNTYLNRKSNISNLRKKYPKKKYRILYDIPHYELHITERRD